MVRVVTYLIKRVIVTEIIPAIRVKSKCLDKTKMFAVLYLLVFLTELDPLAALRKNILEIL